MIYKQLAELCESVGTTPTSFVKEVLKLSSSKVTAWKNGSIPKSEILIQIADYFGVTVGYLFDGKEKSSTVELSKEEQELLSIYKNVSPREQGELIGYARRMLESSSPESREGVS